MKTLTQVAASISSAAPPDFRLEGEGAPQDKASLLDFWSWAFGDLCDDDVKGIFAEWMVARLLDLPAPRRISWANNDLVTRSGIGIEVKASAYWQSWKRINQNGELKVDAEDVDHAKAKIRFGGLRARDSVSPALQTGGTRGLKSQLYVFCFQKHWRAAGWDAWQLDQWDFYVLDREQLEREGVGNSISLAKLKRLCGAMTAAEFKVHMQARETALPPRSANTAS